MKHDQWKEDLHDGVDAASQWPTREALTMTEATQLHKSINATSDPDRMKDDTVFRTNGIVGMNNMERINGIAEAFHQLNMGLDGG